MREDSEGSTEKKTESEPYSPIPLSTPMSSPPPSRPMVPSTGLPIAIPTPPPVETYTRSNTHVDERSMNTNGSSAFPTSTQQVWTPAETPNAPGFRAWVTPQQQKVHNAFSNNNHIDQGNVATESSIGQQNEKGIGPFGGASKQEVPATLHAATAGQRSAVELMVSYTDTPKCCKIFTLHS